MFFIRNLSYFVKPNFIVMTNGLMTIRKINVDVKNKSKDSSKYMNFFINNPNIVGASENNFQSGINANEKELITNNYLVSNSENLIRY